MSYNVVKFKKRIIFLIFFKELIPKTVEQLLPFFLTPHNHRQKHQYSHPHLPVLHSDDQPDVLHQFPHQLLEPVL